MMTFRHSFLSLLSATLLLIGAGCGGGDDLPSNLAPVTGILTVNGKPAANVQVTFSPVDPEAGNPSTGYTNDEGRYTLRYTADNMGAIVGEHKVMLAVGEGFEPEYPEGVDPDKLSEAEQTKYMEEAMKGLPQIPAELTGDDTTIRKTVKEGENDIAITVGEG